MMLHILCRIRFDACITIMFQAKPAIYNKLKPVIGHFMKDFNLQALIWKILVIIYDMFFGLCERPSFGLLLNYSTVKSISEIFIKAVFQYLRALNNDITAMV